jgi:hypothetical protein
MVFVVACVFAPELAIAKRKVVYMLDASVKKTMGISLAELRAKSVSSIVLKVEKEKVEVFLYSKKEEIETIQKPSCGEAVGDKKRRGHYMLVSVKGGLVTSKIVLGDNYFFVEGLLKPWLNDGLRTFLRIEGNVFAIYQHLGCTTKSLEFFRLKGDGTIIKVHFQNKDGLDFTKIFTGFQGETGHYKEPHIFCTPYTAIKHTFCMSYNFTGKSFEQARSWAEPFKKRTDPQSQVAYKKDPAPPYSLRGEARYTLFSYLTALSKGDYKRAAHYYGGAYNRLRRMNPSLNIARFKPEDYRYLKRYCTVNGGKCYIPTSIKDSVLGSNAKGLDSRFVQALGDISRSDGTMKFSVEFVSPGYEQLKVNGRTRFTFKVIKTSKGFKVLDLPPKKKVR